MHDQEIAARPERAAEIFQSGNNCAQAVLRAFADRLDVPDAKLTELSRPFGAGIGGMQSLCGAVSGAFMVLGLLRISSRFDEALSESEAQDNAYSLACEFSEAFQHKHGSIICRNILGIDFSLEADRERFRLEGLKERICLPCVQDAVRILEEMLFSA